MRSLPRFLFRLSLVAWLALTCLLLLSTPVYADDCLRDPLNAKDCARTPGYKQFITTAAVALGVTSVALANLLAPLWQGLIAMDKTGKMAEDIWNKFNNSLIKPAVDKQGADLASKTADLLNQLNQPPPPPPLTQTITPVQAATAASATSAPAAASTTQAATETSLKSWREAEDYLKKKNVYTDFIQLNENDPNYYTKLDAIMDRAGIKCVGADYNDKGDLIMGSENGGDYQNIHLVVDQPVDVPPPPVVDSGAAGLVPPPSKVDTPPVSTPPAAPGGIDLVDILKSLVSYAADKTLQTLDPTNIASYLLGDKASAVVSLLNNLPNGMVSKLADYAAESVLPDSLVPAYYGLKFLKGLADNPELTQKILSRGVEQLGQSLFSPSPTAPAPQTAPQATPASPSLLTTIADGVYKSAKKQVLNYAADQGLKLISGLTNANPQNVQNNVTQFNNNFAGVRDNPVLSNGAKQALNRAAKVINSPTQTPGPEYWQNTLKYK